MNESTVFSAVHIL